MEDKVPTMLYDGDCGFCERAVQRWKKLTGVHIVYLPYQEARTRFPAVSEAACKEAVQLILLDGKVFSAAHAVYKALDIAGKYRFLHTLYHRFPPFRWFSDFNYHVIGHHRKLFSRFSRDSVNKCRGFSQIVVAVAAFAMLAAGVSGYQSFSSGTYRKTPPAKVASTTPTKAVKKTGMKSSARPVTQTSAQQGNKLAALEREITVLANDARPIGPEHYARLRKALDAEMRAGADQTTIRKLLVMLGKVNPDNITSTKPSSPASTPMPVPKENCTAEPPVLTADITDFSKIQKITAPGTASSEGPKGHSFIWTAGARVPIYAPVAATFDSGSYSKDNAGSKAQYLLFFRVKGSCGYQFKFDHIDEPDAAIRAQLPSEPKVADSRGTPATTPVEFKASDLIGYTSGNVPSGNWDFGLYNTKKDGALAAQGSYGIHRNSVCWPDFYAAGKKEAYRRLLDGPRLVCSF